MHGIKESESGVVGTRGVALDPVCGMTVKPEAAAGAFIYNSIGVPIAAGVLYPFFGILLSPMIAAAAMSFSSVSVIGNALRLRRVRL